MVMAFNIYVSLKVIFIKISQNFIKSPLKICKISDFCQQLMACMQGRGGLLLLIAFLVMNNYVQSFWGIAEQEVSIIHSFCEEECTGMPHTGENGCISYSMDTQVPGFWTHKLHIKLVEMDRFVAFVNFVPGIIMISVTTALLKEPISRKFTALNL